MRGAPCTVYCDHMTKAPARNAAAVAAASAKRSRGRQERLAEELTAAGWAVAPPEAGDFPTKAGLYLSDTLHEYKPFTQLGSDGIALWIRCLTHPARRIVRGFAAIPVETVSAMGQADTENKLIRHGAWTYDVDADAYLFAHPGRLYAIIEGGAARVVSGG